MIPGELRANRFSLDCAAAFSLVAMVTLLALGGACDDANHRDIQDEINILTRRNDVLVVPATERLARYGRLAIPQIEVAIHTAAPMGRMHLVDALERIADAEAIPVLRHFAIYDTEADVRGACEAVLARWAAKNAAGSSETTRRSARAGAAILEIARKRAAGEAPLVVDGGTPGAPTVGAPEPVGIELEKSQP